MYSMSRVRIGKVDQNGSSGRMILDEMKDAGGQAPPAFVHCVGPRGVRLGCGSPIDMSR
jgi:hypothetical protein